MLKPQKDEVDGSITRRKKDAAGKTPDVDRMNSEVTVAEIIENQINNATPAPNDQMNGKVTVRIVNLPSDMKIEDVEKLFAINRSSNDNSAGTVVIDRVREKILVKIVVSKGKADELLKFN